MDFWTTMINVKQNIIHYSGAISRAVASFPPVTLENLFYSQTMFSAVEELFFEDDFLHLQRTSINMKAAGLYNTSKVRLDVL